VGGIVMKCHFENYLSCADGFAAEACEPAHLLVSAAVAPAPRRQRVAADGARATPDSAFFYCLSHFLKYPCVSGRKVRACTSPTHKQAPAVMSTACHGVVSVRFAGVWFQIDCFAARERGGFGL
jgi:hypothetical protein